MEGLILAHSFSGFLFEFSQWEAPARQRMRGERGWCMGYLNQCTHHPRHSFPCLSAVVLDLIGWLFSMALALFRVY